jgi:radical SAM superfamily enzyme YgiQ (UPF0313 family)
MAQSGCKWVFLGVESCSQRVLDWLKKGITVRQIRAAVEAIKAAGMNVYATLIVGSPCETAGDVKETCRAVQDMPIDILDAEPLMFVPGTELWYATLRERSLSPRHRWNRVSFTPEFYAHIASSDIDSRLEQINYAFSASRLPGSQHALRIGALFSGGDRELASTGKTSSGWRAVADREPPNGDTAPGENSGRPARQPR